LPIIYFLYVKNYSTFNAAIQVITFSLYRSLSLSYSYLFTNSTLRVNGEEIEFVDMFVHLEHVPTSRLDDGLDID
jgi:hypothetical protein